VVVLNVAQVLLALAVFGVHMEQAQAQSGPAWGWPLAGESVVDRPFQPPATAWGAGHRGVDLRGDEGEWVLAAGDGTVTYSGVLAGRGVATVTHANGLRTTYEPLSATVPVGTRVAQGDRIGSLATGHASCRSGTTCLHWGLLRGETYLDPLSLVTQGRVRLLPLGGSVRAAAAAPATAGRRTAAATAGVVAVQVGPGEDLGSPVEAVAHPRKRAGELLLNQAVNVTGAVALAWGGFVGVRWAVRRVRRR
jgi:murein DD-endopeptidase MepM/ murein hydrolase activator NlpD